MLQTILHALAFIGAWSLISAAVLYLRDRTGNSGRYKHWTEE